MDKEIRKEAEQRYPLLGAPLQFASFCSGARFTKSLIANKIKAISDKEDLTDGEVLDEILKLFDNSNNEYLEAVEILKNGGVV